MKLNRKGYLAVEIILASVVSITIAIFLINITVKLVNRTDNSYVDTIFVSDKALLTKNIKKEIENDISSNGVISSISCSDSNCNIAFNNGSSNTLSISGNVVTYGSYSKEVDKRVGSGKVSSKLVDNKYLIINIVFTNIFDDTDYSAVIPIINIERNSSLADYITYLYKNASKSTVTNNSITYNYASSASLMNDRLGGTTTSLDGGNIRYYGASPNNYIYFNCEEYPSTNCELWRIIGVFDGKVKIMRNESIGSYSWDSSTSGVNSGYGVNEWSQADLMKLLNPGYESESVGGSLYYNSGSGTCYSGSSNSTTSCDFTSSGIKNDTTRGMIAKGVTWNTGGWSGYSVYSNAMYGYERGNTLISSPSDGIIRTSTWTSENQTIALVYPSDYGYAADFNFCSKTLSGYNDSTCTGNNWMKNIFGSSTSSWLLTPFSGSPCGSWYLYSSGLISGYNDNYAYSVVPTVYLDSNVVILGDFNGTIDNPYRIK